MIRDLKDDIMRQMKITEELTNSHCNNKKTALEVEKGEGNIQWWSKQIFVPLFFYQLETSKLTGTRQLTTL